MQPYLTPGNTNEVTTPPSAARTLAADTRPTAFIGPTERGPVNQPVKIKSFAEFETVFGALSAQLPLSYATRLYFLNGGHCALINRIVHNATPVGIELQTDDQPLLLWASCVGSQEHLRAAIDYDGIEAVDADCFNLTVQRLARPFSELVLDQEIFQQVSIDPEHPRYLRRAFSGSSLIKLGEPFPSSRPHITLNHRTGRAEFFRTPTIAGHDGDAVTMADVLGDSVSHRGLFAFSEQHPFAQLNIPPVNFSSDIAVPVLRAAARICDRRRAVLLADAPHSWSNPDEALEALERYSLRGPNVAMYYPWLVTTDLDSGQAMPMPPGGAVAGALDRCMQQTGAAGMPAGRQLPLRSIRRTAVTLSESQSYQFSSRGVNTLRGTSGGRKVIWDGLLLHRQTNSVPATASLKIRRLQQFLYIAIENELSWLATATSDERLWQKIHAQLVKFLTRMMANRVLQGTVPDNAFRIQCDLTTNPRSLRSRSRVGIEVEVALIQPSHFVRLDFEIPVAGSA